MTPTPTIETAVRVLNEAFAASPAAIHALICNRVPCEEALLDHPTVIVDYTPMVGGDRHCIVGMLGVLNGVLEPMTGKRVALCWEEPETEGAAGRLLGFRVYNPATESTE